MWKQETMRREVGLSSFQLKGEVGIKMDILKVIKKIRDVVG